MKRMLFNATQAEELRVAIVDGQKLIDLDIESANKEQRKSNIYKAVITRLEPSLEAAFVDYGAERHGFLPFKEVSRSFFLPGVEAGRARIQDALKVGQELIVQVEKDERGNKGAALTTYVSLAGRYLVLMPNNPRGGGVSRRIEGEDRQELREVMDQLDVPAGMSLIARTAGIGRSAEELQWDLNYLLQLWGAIDGAAKSQNGAFLIYQESSLVIRAIRDYFHAEIGEILIDTDDIYEQAQQFMSHVMPGNVARVKRYSDDVPLFSRFQIEHQIESAYSRQVTLPSGGAIVIDHTEALVSVDVNSGRSTKGADIEETALRTNLEAADEIARQLRLRDLGGLIVIDFIDMESTKSQRDVENRLRDALHFDRARVQTSKISRFGLLELSRQRLRPALAETSYITCPRCTGTGHIRSTESAALHILRILEEEAMKENTGAIHVQVPVDVATFLLNEKRVDIARIEMRHRANLLIIPNRYLETPQHEITRLRHDQLNQDGPTLASYEMAIKPLEEDLSTLAAQAEGKPARAEAAVKGITPDHPAPIVAPKEAPPVAAAPGLFAKIMSWFSGDKKEAEVVAPAKKTDKPVRRERGERSERGERGGRGRRDNREGREGGERKERATTPRGDNRQSRKERPEKGTRTTEAADTAATTEARPARPRPAEKDTPQKESPAIISGSPTESSTTESAGEGSRRRGRRGGRGRSERRNEEAAVAVTGNEVAATVAQTEMAPAIETAAIPTAPTFAQVEQAAIAVEPSIVPVAEPAAAIAIPEPTPAIEAPEPIVASETGVVTEVATAAPTEALTGAPAEPITPAPATEPVAVLISPETPAAPEVPKTVAPVETVAAVAPPPPVDLSASLQQAGLQMVETSNAVAVPAVPSVVQPLGRKPKPAVVIPAEPLQMVETQHKT
ncbi:MAG: Rne/Rng family ribonuclease [Gammaproteobacteria bacterium]|nr:Rne/Rng family ribonuclease [Rhodocyclaceae bacterium]MBU3907934.1 Rne/Rng family ribonuclease [Gammaproteobacteria bacterium]MBU3989776.1 Rne/Rng family ribonuclease [Gammaproteobacteria bacterium]MBU4003840.1 Rne/Rng family ribonuclease [Gammaproteobacteria bacterium]MBU4021718.1 Rne/Rng family ribonuclease [Gammaproteobacteria bacterium]